MADEPKCPNCGAEVDIGQKMCAWCGFDLPKVPPANTSQPATTADSGPKTSPSRADQPVSKGPVSTTGFSSIEEARKLARSGNLDGALMTFEYILSKEPYHQEALFGLGGVHFKKGDKRKAAEAWRKLQDINPDYPHIDSWVAQVQDAPVTPPVSPAPKPQSPPAAPPAFSRRPAQRPPHDIDSDHETRIHSGDDDWTRQSVRVDVAQREAVEEQVIEEPAPRRSEPIPAFKPNPIPIWVTPLSWILVIGYAVLFVGVYFLTE